MTECGVVVLNQSLVVVTTLFTLQTGTHPIGEVLSSAANTGALPIDHRHRVGATKHRVIEAVVAVGHCYWVSLWWVECGELRKILAKGFTHIAVFFL